MYLLQGKLIAKPEQADALANILLQASKLVAQAKGCQLYVISKDAEVPNAVFVTEIWESKADHDNSLTNEDVRKLITIAIPLLESMPTKGQSLEILGGWGI